LVDADTQANSSSGIGFDPQNIKIGLYDCLINETNPKDVIIKSDLQFLDLLPSNINLVGAELEMIDMPNRERVMKAAFENIKKEYDFIIIDCSPSLGLITTNFGHYSRSMRILRFGRSGQVAQHD